MVKNIIEGIQLGLKNSILSFFKWIFEGIIANSFWICLIVCMLCLVLYVAGLKKAGKYCTISLVVYIVLEVMGNAFL